MMSDNSSFSGTSQTRDSLAYVSYSWIGHPVRTQKKCCETERATTDLNIQMKSSRQGASTDGVQKIIFSFFGELFLEKICSNFFARHSWMRLVESSNAEISGASEVPQSHRKLFFRKSSY